MSGDVVLSPVHSFTPIPLLNDEECLTTRIQQRCAFCTVRCNDQSGHVVCHETDVASQRRTRIQLFKLTLCLTSTLLKLSD